MQQLGQGVTAEAHVYAFVGKVVGRIGESGVVGDDPLKFWRSEWSAEHGSQARPESKPEGRMTAAQRTIATMRGEP